MARATIHLDRGSQMRHHKSQRATLPLALSGVVLLSACTSLINPKDPEALGAVGSYAQMRVEAEGLRAFDTEKKCLAEYSTARTAINGDISTLQVYVNGVADALWGYVELPRTKITQTTFDKYNAFSACASVKTSTLAPVVAMGVEIGTEVVGELIKLNQDRRKKTAEVLNGTLEEAKLPM